MQEKRRKHPINQDNTVESLVSDVHCPTEILMANMSFITGMTFRTASKVPSNYLIMAQVTFSVYEMHTLLMSFFLVSNEVHDHPSICLHCIFRLLFGILNPRCGMWPKEMHIKNNLC